MIPFHAFVYLKMGSDSTTTHNPNTVTYGQCIGTLD